jgi:hypothetical protein
LPVPNSRKYLSWAAVGLIVAVSACSQSTTKETASTVTVTASNAGPAQSSAEPGASQKPADPFEATLVRVQESPGTNSINVQLPQVKGGSEDVRDRFNHGMRTALDDLASKATDTTIVDGQLAEDEHSRVTTITPHVVAGVAIFNWYAKGAAHPNNGVATIAVNVDTADPILLTDVFPDQQAAAQRLATKVTELNPDVVPFDQTMDQFLNWVPTPNGFRVYVPVIHAMGDYWPVTVPWDEISDLMTPAARTTLIQ